MPERFIRKPFTERLRSISRVTKALLTRVPFNPPPAMSSTLFSFPEKNEGFEVIGYYNDEDFELVDLSSDCDEEGEEVGDRDPFELVRGQDEECGGGAQAEVPEMPTATEEAPEETPDEGSDEDDGPVDSDLFPDDGFGHCHSDYGFNEADPYNTYDVDWEAFNNSVSHFRWKGPPKRVSRREANRITKLLSNAG